MDPMSALPALPVPVYLIHLSHSPQGSELWCPSCLRRAGGVPDPWPDPFCPQSSLGKEGREMGGVNCGLQEIMGNMEQDAKWEAEWLKVGKIKDFN